MTTIYTHKGIEIQMKVISMPGQIGYTIKHPAFEGKRFNLVQDAIEAIDRM